MGELILKKKELKKLKTLLVKSQLSGCSFSFSINSVVWTPNLQVKHKVVAVLLLNCLVQPDNVRVLQLPTDSRLPL